MRSLRFQSLLIIIVIVITSLACSSLSFAAPQPAPTLNSLYTAAAETFIAMSTQQAATQYTIFSPTPTLSFPLGGTPPVSSTKLPSTVVKCNAAAFITDITYPDGSIIGQGSSFLKIWRIKNTGTCTWTTDYRLVFISGDKLDGKNFIRMPAKVAPGDVVDISVVLTAPDQNGRYKGYWKLNDPSGIEFGFGTQGDAGIYVDVVVKGFMNTKYDFAVNMCDATWRNENQALPCPGSEGSNNGFVIFLDQPKMEDAKSRGNGLVTHPQMINNGLITGKFSPIEIKDGDHFEALISCLHQANDCNMQFKLQYQIGNNPAQPLGQWYEIYEGEFYPINIDLSFLKGNKVKFIFSIASNGSSHEDYALWVNPMITHLTHNPPTLTPSNTQSPTSTTIPTDLPTETATP